VERSAELSEQHTLALEMAANGSVSGTLAELPVLREAFRLAGVPHNDDMHAGDMRRQAMDLCVAMGIAFAPMPRFKHEEEW